MTRGDWVSVTPDDYGNPVHGLLLAWKTDEVIIRHKYPSVGGVNLHFRRAGFDVQAEKKAAWTNLSSRECASGVRPAP